MIEFALIGGGMAIVAIALAILLLIVTWWPELKPPKLVQSSVLAYNSTFDRGSDTMGYLETLAKTAYRLSAGGSPSVYPDWDSLSTAQQQDWMAWARLFMKAVTVTECKILPREVSAQQRGAVPKDSRSRAEINWLAMFDISPDYPAECD